MRWIIVVPRFAWRGWVTCPTRHALRAARATRVAERDRDGATAIADADPARRDARRTTCRTCTSSLAAQPGQRVEHRRVAAAAVGVARRDHAARHGLDAAQHRAADGDLAAGPAVLLPRRDAVDRDRHAEAARVGHGAVERRRERRERAARTSATPARRRRRARPRRASAAARAGRGARRPQRRAEPSTTRPRIGAAVVVRGARRRPGLGRARDLGSVGEAQRQPPRRRPSAARSRAAPGVARSSGAARSRASTTRNARSPRAPDGPSSSASTGVTRIPLTGRDRGR